MGFFSGVGDKVPSWWSRGKQAVGNAIGTVGGITRRMGEVGGKVLRTVGTFAPIVADVVAAGSMALGQPELAVGAEAIGQVIRKVGDYANKGATIANKAQNFGGMAEGFGKNLVGGM